jgi:predicted nucleotidyltransferase component of viral defense system
VFRGGTALHKLHLPAARRYSEDLDYVRSTAGGIGPILDRLKDIGRSAGFAANSQMGQHPKVVWRTIAESGSPLRVKVEINTHERSPALPLAHLLFQVESAWWSGQAKVATFQPPELVATKIRALYQRSKGRDLFDLWLAMTTLKLDPHDVLSAFAPYRPDGLTRPRAVANLRAKLADQQFRNDLTPLAAPVPGGYDIDQAANLVIDQLLDHL